MGLFGFGRKKKHQQDASDLVEEAEKKAESAEEESQDSEESSTETAEAKADVEEKTEKPEEDSDGEKTDKAEDAKPSEKSDGIKKTDANLALSEQLKASMGKGNKPESGKTQVKPAPEAKKPEEDDKIKSEQEKEAEKEAQKKIQQDKIKRAEAGKENDLDQLCFDPDWQVREAVAKHGRQEDLDRLVHDKEIWVRQAVAEHGRDKDLDKLVNDPSPFVRMVVAQKGRDVDLDKLVNDKSATIRKIVANKGRAKDLIKLIKDQDSNVRYVAVAATKRLKAEMAKEKTEAKPEAPKAVKPTEQKAADNKPASPASASVNAAKTAKQGEASKKPEEAKKQDAPQAKTDQKPVSEKTNSGQDSKAKQGATDKKLLAKTLTQNAKPAEVKKQEATDKKLMPAAAPIKPLTNAKPADAKKQDANAAKKLMPQAKPAKPLAQGTKADEKTASPAESSNKPAAEKTAPAKDLKSEAKTEAKTEVKAEAKNETKAGDATRSTKNTVKGGQPNIPAARSAEIKKAEAKSGKIVSDSGLTISTTEPAKPKAEEKPASLAAAKKPAQQSKPQNKQQAARKQPQKVVAQPIIISFRCEGKKIADDFAFTGKPGTLLKKDNLPEIPGYSIKNGFVPNKRISVERQTVTINYEPSSVTYRIIPVTEDLKPISTGKHYKGRAGSTIEQFPQVKGYRQAEARKYSVPNEPGKDIKVVYVPVRQTIRVVYRAENGEVLSEEHISGNTGTKYEVKLNARHFDGYEIGHVPNNMTGTFGPDSPDVVIEYVPTDSKIIVDFVDESGNTIHKTLEETGKFKSEYSLKLPIIDGYELASNPDLLTGRFSSTPRRIVLSFRPAPANFTIHYWIGKDKSVHAAGDKEVEGTVGDRYMAASPSLQGLMPDKEMVEGVFSAYGNEDVDVIYTPIHCKATVTFRAPDGSPIRDYVPKKFEGDWGQDFEFKLPDIAGYEKPEDTYSSTFVAPVQAESIYYKPLQGSVKVRYVNSRTKSDVEGYPAKVVSGLVGTAYNIDPEIIDGYRLSKVPDNASGVFAADMAEVTFTYNPSLSELVLHYYDSTLNSLAPNSSLKGYYGEPYQIDPNANLKGYELVSTSFPLEGTFPPNRQDVDLYYKAAQVTFELVPTNQFGDEIGDKYNIRVTGLMNQTFSERLPEIPGYFAKYSSIEDTIREEYANKRIKINYAPKSSSVTVHSFYKGGNHSGEHVFDDETFNGKVGENFEYPARTVEGYTPSVKLLTTKFKADPQDMTIVYNVNTEDYLIHYKDPNDVLVGGMPQATGYYGQAVDVSGSVPRGFHMLSGADSKIYLDGSGVYNIAVNPDELLVDVVPQTADGVSLMAPRQVSGEYHVPQEITVPEIAGFDPVKGSTITISFELGQTTLPVIYTPQARSITVRYISVEGNEVHEPTVVHGHYQERYRIDPLKIDGYFVLKDEPKVGIYGLSDSNVTFVYRAGSDEYSRAVTPLSEILKQQNVSSSQEDVSEPQYNNNDFVGQTNPQYQVTENSENSTNGSLAENNQSLDQNVQNESLSEQTEKVGTADNGASDDNDDSSQSGNLLDFLDKLQ